MNKESTVIGMARNIQWKIKKIDVNTMLVAIKGIPSQAIGSLLRILLWSKPRTFTI